jgi:aspartyl-tRNA(Asn)/glutamyl-tRNA(Gln) amidotransferase subunit B
LPELPVARLGRFVREFGLSIKDADTITGHRGTADLFETVIKAGAPPEIVVKQFVNVWLTLANDRGVKVTELNVDARRMAELARMVADGTVNKSAVNQIAAATLDHAESPTVLAESMGLIQIQDMGATEAWVKEAFAANAAAVQDAIGNPKKSKAATGFLRGQVMKISAGKADPKLVGELIERRLTELSGSSGEPSR